MRRIVAGLLCFLLVGAWGHAATARTGAGAEALRGAGASWWSHDGESGTLYFLDVYDITGTYRADPHQARAYFGAVACDVGNRDRPRNCDWRHADFSRVKVVSFEIDPVMQSAHAVVRLGNRRGEVTWTGQGEYNRPFLWEHASEFADPPHFAQVGAGVIA